MEQIDGFGSYVWPQNSRCRVYVLKPDKVLAYLLSLAGICPFVGSMSDIMGRRWVAIIGAILVLLGMIVSSTAKAMNPFIGMSIKSVRGIATKPNDRRHDLGWYWCWDPRTHGTGGDVGAGSDPKARQIRRDPGLHHHPVLPVGAMGSIDCVECRLEVLRPSLWYLERRRSDHDRDFLPPTAESELFGDDENGDPQTNRYRWRCAKYLWNDLVYGRTSMGRLPGT